MVNIVLCLGSGLPGMAHAAAARAGVVNLTRTLANEWGRHGIRVALNSREYQELAVRSHRGLRPVQPLAAAEADRPRLRGATEVVAIHAAARG